MRWWEHLASTPGADSWTEADWDNLMNAALIHADIWGSGNFASVPILNKLLQDYGITPSRTQPDHAGESPEAGAAYAAR